MIASRFSKLTDPPRGNRSSEKRDKMGATSSASTASSAGSPAVLRRRRGASPARNDNATTRLPATRDGIIAVARGAVGVSKNGNVMPLQKITSKVLQLAADDGMEHALRVVLASSGSSKMLTCMFGLLQIISLEYAGYGWTPLIFGVVGLGLLFALHEELCTKAALHDTICKVWTVFWSIACVWWWALVIRGTMPRLGREDQQKMLACCCFWITTLVLQHVRATPHATLQSTCSRSTQQPPAAKRLACSPPHIGT